MEIHHVPSIPTMFSYAPYLRGGEWQVQNLKPSKSVTGGRSLTEKFSADFFQPFGASSCLAPLCHLANNLTLCFCIFNQKQWEAKMKILQSQVAQIFLKVHVPTLCFLSFGLLVFPFCIILLFPLFCLVVSCKIKCKLIQRSAIVFELLSYRTSYSLLLIYILMFFL